MKSLSKSLTSAICMNDKKQFSTQKLFRNISLFKEKDSLTLHKIIFMNFWTRISRFILKNQLFILLTIAVITVLLGSQTKHIKFSYTEANLLPEDHPENLNYTRFLNVFGEEGTLIVLAVKDPTLFTPEKFNNWNQLAKDLELFSEIDFSISIGNLKALKKDKKNKCFKMVPLVEKSFKTPKEIEKFKRHLFDNYPFYNNLLFNKKTQTVQTALYLGGDAEQNLMPERARDLVTAIHGPPLAVRRKVSRENSF